MNRRDTPSRRVRCPSGYANAELNGELVMPIDTFDNNVTRTMILTGEHAGQVWLFRTDHLEAA